MRIDLKRVPFSAPGAFLSVSDITGEIWGGRFPEDGLYLRTVRGGFYSVRNDGLARLRLMQGEAEVPFTYEATPSMLSLAAPQGEVTMAFDEKCRLHIEGRGVSLKLDLPPNTYDEFLHYADGRAYLNGSSLSTKLMFSRTGGEMLLTDPGIEARSEGKAVRMDGERWGLIIEEFTWMYRDSPYEPGVSKWAAYQNDAFTRYVDAMPACPERHREAAKQAAYVNWSAQVGPDGLIEGHVMLMSKNWMKNIWTWDCAFNAVCCGPFDPDAAWDNFASPFRRQHESGMLLDMVNDHTWYDAYTKPPIHGWALKNLREMGVLTDERREWIYPRLIKWVNSWYELMDWDHDGICQYNHGNDSGWDNCTNFLCGAPMEGPDLSCYLVLCLDELAILADQMGKPDEAADFRTRAEKQLKAILEHSWDGERFHVYQSGTHAEKEGCDSLFPFLPVLLGDRLPRAVFEKLAAGLKEENRFLTPYGLATERVGNEYYVSDGYWRGPIWAPPMMFIIEGLYRGGETAFAKDLAERFLTNCAVNGFAENFDAATGAGLRDRAYTWTSSVFLILARDYSNK